MVKNISLYLLPLLLSAHALSTQAQGTAEDYKRANGLREKYKASKVTGDAHEIKWTSDSTFTFATYQEDGKEMWCEGHRANGEWSIGETKRPSTEAHHPRQERNGGRDVSTLQGPQPVRNHWMNEDAERWGRPVYSPDSSLIAYIKNDNLHVSLPNGKEERQLSYDGTLSLYYSTRIQWSPDGRYVTSNRIQPIAQKRYVYYVESSPRSQLQPILHQQEYAKPGDERTQKTPCVFEVATGKAIIPDNSLFDHQYDLWGPYWSEDSRHLFFEYNERGHQTFRVLDLNVETGIVQPLIEEKSETFVNYNRHFLQFLNHDTQALWMSERDNWNHLYLYDFQETLSKNGASNKNAALSKNAASNKNALSKNAALSKNGALSKNTKKVRQITQGEWVVRQVLRIDEERGLIFFSASGMNPDEDPYLVHYYRIGLDGKNLVCLTPEEGNHKVQYNDSYTWLIDTYSKVDQAPKSIVRPVDNPSQGKVIGEGDLTKLKAEGWVAPEVFVAPGRDGVTPMWGIIQRPTNFDPSRSYPIIEYIYAGPGDAYTPKSFSAYNWNMTSLAELGFIVVQLDGMGTSYRGKKFEDVCYKNLKDAGFPDRIAWIKAAAEKYPYMDAERVGIYGASAGGQESTAAVLWHGDFYKAAYSSCGCHDNRMDKIWWNEQWMGYPVDSSYVASSNVANAHLLNRPLMLVVGEMDDNVDPSSTYQLVDALIRANKDFDFILLPGIHHTMGEYYGEHKRYDFFAKHLLGVEPPKWEEIK